MLEAQQARAARRAAVLDAVYADIQSITDLLFPTDAMTASNPHEIMERLGEGEQGAGSALPLQAPTLALAPAPPSIGDFDEQQDVPDIDDEQGSAGAEAAEAAEEPARAPAPSPSRLPAAAASASEAAPPRTRSARGRLSKAASIERRLQKVNEKETAGILRMSCGMLLVAASKSMIHAFDSVELPLMFINDASLRGAVAADARIALAAFGAAMVLGRPPTTLSIQARGCVTDLVEAPNGSSVLELPFLPFEIIEYIVDMLAPQDVATVGCLSLAWCEAAQTKSLTLQRQRVTKLTECGHAPPAPTVQSGLTRGGT